jgi:outer membrane protein TolC
MSRRLGLVLLALLAQPAAALAEQPDRKPMEVTVTPPRKAPAARPATDPITTSGIQPVEGLRAALSDPDGATAVGLAIAGSASLRSFLAEEDAADARVLRGKLAFLPTITGSVRASDGPGAQDTIGNPSILASVSLNMTLFDGGRRLNQLRGARSAAAGAAGDAEAQRLQVAADTLGGMIELDFAQRQAGILAETLKGLQTTLSAVRSRRDAGLADNAEVAEVEAEIADAQRGLAAARGAADRARAGLRGQLGLDVAGRPRLPALERLLELGPDGLAELARTGSPKVQAAWNRYDAAEFNRRATLGKYLPRLDLGAEYGATRNYSPLSDPAGFTVGLTLTVPILDATTVAEVRESRALAAAARYRAIDEANRMETQARMGWADYVSADERMSASARKTGALRRALASKREQYRAGLIPVDDVLYLSRRVAESGIQEAEARSQRHGALVSLGAGAGVLVDEVGGNGAPYAELDPVTYSVSASGLPGVAVPRAGRRDR